MKRSNYLVLIVLGGSLAQAATITGATAGGDPVSWGNYTVSVKPRPVEHISTGDMSLHYNYYFDYLMVAAGFPDWIVSIGSDAAGIFDVLQYDPFITDYKGGKVGGANYTALYNDGDPNPRSDYMWVSIAHRHNWGRFGSGVGVDPANDPPWWPGYYNADELDHGHTSPGLAGSGEIWLDAANYPQQNFRNPAGGGKVPAGDLLFNDQPYCSLTCADLDGYAEDIFDTYLVSYTWNGRAGADARGTIVFHDGMEWGVRITTPEAGTWTMLLAGALLVALGHLGRRRHGHATLYGHARRI